MDEQVSTATEITRCGELFTLYTSINITASGVYSDVSQQNWDSLITVISMRSQPILLQEPVFVENMKDHGSRELKGPGYYFTFTSEHEGIYSVYDSITGEEKEFQMLIEMIEGITLNDIKVSFFDNQNIEIIKNTEK